MNRNFPIYTEITECHDCYKCVRRCPVKAIKIRDGHAAVLPEKCVACGSCIQVCPASAKQIRNDTGRLNLLLQKHAPVIVSLAPSWVTEFPDLTEHDIVSRFMSLGFHGVSETSLGAARVSQQLDRYLAMNKGRLFISTACPSACEFICKYHPHLIDNLIPFPSPALTHAKMIKSHVNKNAKIVFVGPCVAKKLEADTYPDLISLSITYSELRKWAARRGVNFKKNPLPENQSAPDPTDNSGTEKFLMGRSASGAVYPVPGGSIESLRKLSPASNTRYVQISGLGNLARNLENIRQVQLNHTVFLECLACEGGCVQGPTASPTDIISADDMIFQYSEKLEECSLIPDCTNTVFKMSPRPLIRQVYSESDIEESLKLIGKYRQEDELNCGGCGYDSCRDFAVALLDGNAEPSMCSSYMRQIASMKANALLRCIPSGLVIADSHLKIVECNRPFAEMMGPETRDIFISCPGLKGAALGKILPCEDLFVSVLQTGNDIVREHLQAGELLLNITIFPVEPQKTVGAIVRKVTEVEIQREQIARRAKEVIKKNLETVQVIASRLGEHMADTEIILNSIAKDFSPAGEPEDNFIELPEETV